MSKSRPSLGTKLNNNNANKETNIREKDVVESSCSSHRRKDNSTTTRPVSSEEGGRLKEFGDWSEQVSSSGKVYYYNRVTEVSQWDRPKQWRAHDRAQHNKTTTTTEMPVETASPSFTSGSSGGGGGVEAMSMEESDETTPSNGEVVDGGGLSASHAAFARPELCGHVRGWATEHFESEARAHAATALQQSLAIGSVTADLKCARSLVRTAEMRCTLLASRRSTCTLFEKNMFSSSSKW